MSLYKKILIAVDFSAATSRVVEQGIGMANTQGAKLHFIHVVEYLPPVDFANDPIAIPDWYAAEDEIIKRAEKSLQQMIQENKLQDTQSLVISGAPKHEIIQYAKDNDIDLIVIGSHGRHGFQRLLGSTANPVVHNAECDVLAVRIHE